MTETNDKINNTSDSAEKKTLTLTKKTDGPSLLARDHVHQRFARGRSKTVEVEVKRKRTGVGSDKSKNDSIYSHNVPKKLTGNEFDVRMKAVKESLIRQQEIDRKRAEEEEFLRLNPVKVEETPIVEAQSIDSSSTVETNEKSLESNTKIPSDSKFDTSQDQNRSSNIERQDSSANTRQDSATQNVTNQSKYKQHESNSQGKSDYRSGTSDNKKPYDSSNPQRKDNRPNRTQNNDGTSHSKNYKGGQDKYNRSHGPNDYAKHYSPESAQAMDMERKKHHSKNPTEKKQFSKDDIKPIVLRANGYGTKPSVSHAVNPQTDLAIDPILDKNRGEHRAAVNKVRRKVNEDDEAAAINSGKVDPRKAAIRSKTSSNQEGPRKLNRNVISRVLDDDSEFKGRSLASMKRARQKHFKKQNDDNAEALKILRDVIIPETITVGELANRMAVRGADVVKSLMKLGMMVTINQVIDADTAELICTEFGHTPKRVADSDIEIGLGGADDLHEDLLPRAPVVTVMGHVDHGKTSLLDALRETDVVSGEAGGITQHIGAYQVTMQSGKKITFIDTPGHAAFSEMRARGANATDIVVLVVAADDGIMAQTIEAISHAKAANVPIVVAINKIDKPDANPMRVRQELLQHGVLLEEFGGDVMAVEVSAKKRLQLEKLEETILLQAEVLELKANPARSAQGVVVEAKIDKGRGTVATVLVQRGTLSIGDVFVAGSEWGRVKAIVNDHGKKIMKAEPSMPIEVLGFNGVPSAGDEFFVVEDEQRAREIAEYRSSRQREKQTIVKTKGGMENIMNRIVSGEMKELSLVIKADVQGSLEAINASVAKLSTNEVSTRVLHGAVGSINESDITLARASGGLIVGFNVRANPQARELARRDGVEIRYYSIIYDVIDDVKGLMGGLLAPTLREKYLGSAEIRDVFTISKVGGKVAGSYVLDGMMKRGGKVRLLRDSVVIYEGELKSLKRFKDEVKEVKESYECGMVFENYDDIKKGDVVECFEIESIARQL